MKRDFGFVEWFRPGEQARVEQLVPAMAASGARHLRTHLSWAEYHAPGGEEWFDWLIPRLAADFELLPCIHYTPPSLSRTGRCSGPPTRLQDYADFIDTVLTRHGAHFTHVELWNEPNNLLDWDWRIDPDFALFCEMVGAAAHWARERGWKPVLAGPSPFDPYWLNLMGERGLLPLMTAVGIHGFPGTWDSAEGAWSGWDMHLGEMRAILDRWAPDAEIWITETGYSTWRRDEMEQVRRFAQALRTSADRVYWYGWQDLPADVASQEGLWFDPRHYHLGAVSGEGQPKLLARILETGGPRAVEAIAGLASPRIARPSRLPLITGGCGFIGANLAESFLREGREVILLDNLSRPGVEQNLAELTDRFGSRVHPAPVDLRDDMELAKVVADAESIVHLAAQTAVTTSLGAPIHDFDVNARGTLNVLEAARAQNRRIPLVFASTNKVYGALADLAVAEGAETYAPRDPAIAASGVDETRPLDFCTPYGCSKGVADQYVLDYAKSFGMPATVLRMSCVYGRRQFGTEDQGWVAHFLIRALQREPITIYGTGRQVRDVLEVTDAVAAYRVMLEQIDLVSGRAFNLGGGPANAVSLRQVIAEIGDITGRPVDVRYEAWRPGDQPWFVADASRLRAATGWMAVTPWRRGLRDLAGWLREARLRSDASIGERLSA